MQAEWLWIDSKFSASTLNPSKRGSAASRPATPRTRSSTKRGLSYARSVTYFSSARFSKVQLARRLSSAMRNSSWTNTGAWGRTVIVISDR